VGTASTKSRAGKIKGAKKVVRAQADAPVERAEVSKRKESEPQPTVVSLDAEIPHRLWLGASALILITGAFLRIYDYSLKPFHHDEGVNGFFLINLFRNHVYTYDPSNYHGPTLYYFSLLTSLLFGLNDFAVRLVPALFGVATILLMLALRRYIGTTGALTAAALVAFSPAAVFYSRYFIHESLFVFFSVAMVFAGLKFDEAERPEVIDLKDGWIGLTAAIALALLSLLGVRQMEGLARELPLLHISYRNALLLILILILGIYLYFMRRFGGGKSSALAYLFASAALLFATKETALITVGVFVIALVSTDIYMKMRRPSAVVSQKGKAKRRKGESIPKARGLTDSLRGFGGSRDWLILLASVAALFVMVHVLFYSSFFTNPKGLHDSLATFKIWMRTGTSEFHAKTWETYLYWLWQEEALLLLLGAGGAILAAWRAANRFAVFSALWTIGIIAAYSLVPYKTPWLVLSFIPPLAIMGGYLVNELYCRENSTLAKATALTVAAIAVCFALYQTVVLNFYYYDDERYPYVYAHTQRGYLSLIREIESAAQRAGTKEQTTISIASPDYWPMPWYLRNFKSVAYPQRVGNHTEQIVVCKGDQEKEAQALLGGRYRRVGAYPLRSGIMLVLYERNDIP
jgi:uncharacterized protein (TIGR03663 family)